MYSHYFNNSRSLGKILFCLCQTGIPLHIVENVIYEYKSEIYSQLKYGNQVFADVTWDGNIPVFYFSEPRYNQLKQPKYYEVFVRDRDVFQFNSKEQLYEIRKQQNLLNMDVVVMDILRHRVNDQLEPLGINETNINEKINRLQKHFGKKKHV